MHVLYVHPNYPAQFGHIAKLLAAKPGWRCTFVSRTADGFDGGVEKMQHQPSGGATQTTHFCSRTFENSVWQCDAVYRALKDRPDIRPDLIVGHSGFGSTLFLRELYPKTPIINLFEYYYRPHEPDDDMDFRSDLGWKLDDMQYARARCRNAMLLLDLQNCHAGYAPTRFQKSRFPPEYQPKLRVIFDGIDRGIYHGHDGALRPPIPQRAARTIGGVQVGPTTRIVTYVSRGFESMRGFDIFMRCAKRIAEQFPDVIFIVVGSDRVAYGGDEGYLEGKKTFKEWVLAREEFDLSKFAFVGRLEPGELARLLASTDLHIYLTAPFVLSWSMMDAMSCGAVVLGSDTPPVREMIANGENGLLVDFFDVEGMAERAVEVLLNPEAFRRLGEAAEQMIARKYSLDATLPKMVEMYEEVCP
ncbi:MAG TPA: glycosyltransferase [Tepidisphaeraceae bacterium]|jgi:glycosyltransferase involved in cell wall biosynthesis